MRSGRALAFVVGVAVGVAALARANGPVGDGPVFAKIDALRPVATTLAIDGNGADWGAIPSLPDPAGDAGGDGSRDILGLAIAPLADGLAVRITTAATPSTFDLSFWLYVDYVGRELVDLEIGLYPGFDDILWTYPEGGASAIQYWHDAELAVGNVVEARISYAALAPALPPGMAAALTDPSARSYVRVIAFTRDYSQAGAPLIDTGPAVASFRLIPTPYVLDPPLPAPGTPVAVPPALAGNWYVGKGPFSDGAHTGVWAYDLSIVDGSLFPDAPHPGPSNSNYPSFGQPITAPVAGIVRAVDSANDDLPPRSSAVGNPNFVFMEIAGDVALFFDHLKKDTITAQPDQPVAAGELLGQVGHSGSNTWPHLHLSAETFSTAVTRPLAHTEVEVGLNPVTADPWLRWLPSWALREGMFVRPAGALCGDVAVNEQLEAADVSALRAYLANPSGAPLSSEGARRCTVIGAPRPCDARDVAVLRRKVATPSRPPGIAQVCPAALGT